MAAVRTKIAICIACIATAPPALLEGGLAKPPTGFAAVSEGHEISPEVLIERRASLLELIGPGIAVIRGASVQSLAQHPQASHFRQDNDFYYLTGLEIPDAWLVMFNREGRADSVVLFVPERDPAAEVWTGTKLGASEETARITGIVTVRPVSRFEEEFLWRLSRKDELAEFREIYLPRGGASGELSVLRELAVRSGRAVGQLSPALAQLRLVKDSVELDRLQRAVHITVEAQREVMKAARPGMYEYELEAILEYVFRARGAERVGFPSIVGSGPNSVILHHDTNRRRMEAGDLVVVDIGAEYGYYTADVTRTFPVDGRFTPRQRDIYELVLMTQETVLASVQPGVTLLELSEIARDYLREHSRGSCGERSCDYYFIHSVGHWLGMGAHDVGSPATPLAPGMVLTIEPGIYLADEDLGVRIEDDVVVTEDGHDLLSAGAPRTVKEIEALMREESRLGPDR